MTLLTSDGAVLADQGKSRQIMIKENTLAPSRLVVAFLALGALLLMVNVVVPVTFNTVGLEFRGHG